MVNISARLIADYFQHVVNVLDTVFGSILSPIMHSVNVLWRLKHPLTMSVAERESEILKFETQEREDKHETMRILNTGS